MQVLCKNKLYTILITSFDRLFLGEVLKINRLIHDIYFFFFIYSFKMFFFKLVAAFLYVEN